MTHRHDAGPYSEVELYFAVGYLPPGGTVATVLKDLLSIADAGSTRGTRKSADTNRDAGTSTSTSTNDRRTQRHPAVDEPAARVWNSSSTLWATGGFVFDVPAVGAWPARETVWHNYLLRASLTFDSFYGTHVINQNGNYQYQWGQLRKNATPPAFSFTVAVPNHYPTGI